MLQAISHQITLDHRYLNLILPMPPFARFMWTDEQRVPMRSTKCYKGRLVSDSSWTSVWNKRNTVEQIDRAYTRLVNANCMSQHVRHDLQAINKLRMPSTGHCKCSTECTSLKSIPSPVSRREIEWVHKPNTVVMTEFIAAGLPNKLIICYNPLDHRQGSTIGNGPPSAKVYCRLS